MTIENSQRPIEILLVEDNPGDVRLTREAFRETGLSNHLHVVGNGDEAIDFLRRQGGYLRAPRPDIILLDINLPGKNGHEVLAEIKDDDALKTIPVCVFTSSEADRDIAQCYRQHANCYINKPADFAHFIAVAQGIEDFWLGIATLPGMSRDLQSQ